MMKLHLLFAAACLLLGLAACKPTEKTSLKKGAYHYSQNTKSVEELRKIENRMDLLFYMYCGEFTNARQSKARSEDIAYSIEQDIITLPIWQDRTGEYWLYTAWFKRGMPEPLTHGIARLSRDNRDTFRLTFYQLPDHTNAEQYAEEWKKERPFEHLKPKDLLHTPNCHNFIVQRDDYEFELIPLPNGEACPYYISPTRQYMRYAAKISLEGINQYTEFLDSTKQVSFAYPRPEGFELQRVPKKSEK